MLQLIQNSLACSALLVPLQNTPQSCSIISNGFVLTELRELRVKLKLACLTCREFSTITSSFLHALPTPPSCLQSSYTGLSAASLCKTVMGSSTFHASAPKEKNGLLPN